MLCSAVIENRIDACRLLIELGAQITASAFAQARSMEMVELLRTHLPQSSLSTSGILIKAREPRFIRALLRSQVVDVNASDSSGESALLRACSQPRLIEKVEILLESEADVHVRGSWAVADLIFKGDTPCTFYPTPFIS